MKPNLILEIETIQIKLCTKVQRLLLIRFSKTFKFPH